MGELGPPVPELSLWKEAMNPKYEKLTSLLKELFQLDQPELDFGFYRIMHAKQDEIATFLDRDLLPQVTEAFALYRSADTAELHKRLAELSQQVADAGIDPDQSPKVRELREQVSRAIDVSAVEAEVFDTLYSFFRRYYEDGDFLAKRVYKPGVYALPYEGEEVKLHWANSDQYYIKTSEYLRDYAFKLCPLDATDPMRVHFELAGAAEGAHGNVKTTGGKERVFVLSQDEFLIEEAGELRIRFDYRPSQIEDWPEERRASELKKEKPKPPSRKEALQIAEQRVLSIADPALNRWIKALGTEHVKASGEPAGYSILASHLTRYAARNTFDYFIHKDLGVFLRRELDFFIKNEVMRLDDIESASLDQTEQYLSKIKVIREIAKKLILFLEQLEGFQKKLWLKKKFVAATEYCVSLDRVPRELYAEVALNEAQREEWVSLFAIDELASDGSSAGYSVPLTEQFLLENQNLLLDTRLFDGSFTDRLVASIDNIDAETTGVLVHGDNFQALRLLRSRLQERVRCVYIDPPYNTDSSSIPYKNDYKHSTFATMMRDRLEALHPLIREDGALFVSIDKTERTVVEHVADSVFGQSNRVEELIWSMNTNNSQAPNYSTNHEYVLVYAKDRSKVEQDRDMFREPKPGYEEVTSLVTQLNLDYPSVEEIEAQLARLYATHKSEYRDEVESQGLEWEEEKGNDPWKGIYSYGRAEYRDATGRMVPEDEASAVSATIWVWQEGDASMPATKQAESTRDSNHKNWRFYKPPHPTTKQPCPHPKSGWKFAYDDDEDSPDKRSFVSLDRDGRIAWGDDEQKVPRLKRMLHEVETNVGKSVFVDYSDGEKQTSAMFGTSGVFLAPKHADFVSRFVQHATREDDYVLDCFGGSGSTAHAVIKLNRDDRSSKRRFLLVEVGDYFDTVLKPRVLKAAYSRDWRSGKPVSREGLSQCIKVLRLESYEDTLNNLELKRTPTQQNLLESSPSRSVGGFRESYMLRYMLDVETKESPSLLNSATFDDPRHYALKVRTADVGETLTTHVDLIETFNCLLGLEVTRIDDGANFNASCVRDDEGRLQLGDPIEQSESGKWWFRTVAGCTHDGRRALIIWRNNPGAGTLEGVEEDNLVLNEWFLSKFASPAVQSRPDVIYVNGDCALASIKGKSDAWSVRLLESDFHRLMFEEGN